MSIRMIAKDLYKLMAEVEALEKRLQATPFEKQGPVADKLRRAKADLVQMKRILDGRKGDGGERKRRFI